MSPAKPICGERDTEGSVCVREPGHPPPHYKAAQVQPPHHCHAIDCSKSVPPKMLMCLKHWRMVPRENQRTIWATYRPGQEDDKQPSLLYLVNQQLAVAAVAEKEGKNAEAEKCRAQAARFAEEILAARLADGGKVTP